MSADLLELECNLNPDDALAVFPSATEGQRLLVLAAHCGSDAESVYLSRRKVTDLRNYLDAWLAKEAGL